MRSVWWVVFLVVTVGSDDPAISRAFSAVSARTTRGGVSAASSSSSASAFDSVSVRQAVTQRLREGVFAVRSGRDAVTESRRVAVRLAREVGPYVLRTQVSGSVVGDGRATATATAGVSVGGVMRVVGAGCMTAFVQIENARSIFASRAAIDVAEGAAEDGEDVFVTRAADSVSTPLSDAFGFLKELESTTVARTDSSSAANRPRGRQELKQGITDLRSTGR